MKWWLKAENAIDIMSRRGWRQKVITPVIHVWHDRCKYSCYVKLY